MQLVEWFAVALKFTVYIPYSPHVPRNWWRPRSGLQILNLGNLLFLTDWKNQSAVLRTTWKNGVNIPLLAIRSRHFTCVIWGVRFHRGKFLFFDQYELVSYRLYSMLRVPSVPDAAVRNPIVSRSNETHMRDQNWTSGEELPTQINKFYIPFTRTSLQIKVFRLRTIRFQEYVSRGQIRFFLETHICTQQHPPSRVHVPFQEMTWILIRLRSSLQ